jgi:general stress protein YciG
MPKGKFSQLDDNKKRGFGGMDPVKQREIASAGGKKAHELGRAHRFTPEEATIAGRKGGAARKAKNAAVLAGTAQPNPPSEAGKALEGVGQALRGPVGTETIHREE